MNTGKNQVTMRTHVYTPCNIYCLIKLKYNLTAGYTCTDHKTNTEIAKELSITPVLDKIQEYRRNWLQQINRMPRITENTKKKTTDQKAEETRRDC